MKIIVAVAIIIICCAPSHAGDMWLTTGGGVGSEGLAWCTNGSMQIGEHALLSLRGAGSWNLDVVNDDNGFLFDQPSFRPGVSDFGFLIGWVNTTQPQRNSISFSVGIGSTTITEKGDLNERSYLTFFGAGWTKEQQTTTGFLLQSQLFAKKFGFQAFADFNPVRSFGGIVLSYRFLRSH